MNIVIKRTRTILVSAAVIVLAAACSGNPFDSGTASSSVQFALAGARTSAGAFLCSEADLAQLSTTPAGSDMRSDSRSVTGDCNPSFTVTVPKGDVSFVGELMGRGRPLMRGALVDHPIREDGFRVVIDLEEIPAINLRTETLGLGGPDSYEYEVDGTDTRVPIGKNATDSVPALAAGARNVTLFGACGVEGGPVHEVMIPVDEAERDSTVFRVDCNQVGSVEVTVTTDGTAGPPAFSVDVGDKLMNRIGRNATISVTDVTPGPIDVVLDTQDQACTENDVTAVQPHFLSSGGSLRVEFLVFCLTRAFRGDIQVNLTPVMTPGIGEVETFDVTVVGTDNVPQTMSIQSASGSARFTNLETLLNPYSVMLTPTGSCLVLGAAVQTASVPAGSTRIVTFDVGC